MKAIVYYEYGPPDVLKCEDVQKPTAGDDEVLIKVHAVSANPLDWRALRADPFFIRLMGEGFLKPKNKILGVDVAGLVEAVGRNVKEFHPGDAVFGTSNYGGFAEYVRAREDRLVLKPPGTTFEEAAAVPVAAGSRVPGLRVLRKIEYSIRLRRKDAGAADFRGQQAADAQQAVADQLRFKPDARAAREQPVLRITRQEIRCQARALAVRGTHDDRLVHFLH